jgi:Fur family peroxide stress response transcriptional regulator
MIYHELKADHPSLSLGTVYRNLNLLLEEGRAVCIPSTTNRYDGNTKEHPHFYCTACGKLYDLELPMEDCMVRAAENLGFQVERCDLIFKGVCPQCLGLCPQCYKKEEKGTQLRAMISQQSS